MQKLKEVSITKIEWVWHSMVHKMLNIHFWDMGVITFIDFKMGFNNLDFHSAPVLIFIWPTYRIRGYKLKNHRFSQIYGVFRSKGKNGKFWKNIFSNLKH